MWTCKFWRAQLWLRTERPTHPIAVSMSEKVAPECTAHPDTKASRRSSLSEIADEGIRAAGSGHRSSIAGRRNSRLTAAMTKSKPLGCGIKSAYSLPRLVLSGFDYTIRPARVTVYREAFGMPIMTMSMLVSICKSLGLSARLPRGQALGQHAHPLGAPEAVDRRLFADLHRRHSAPRVARPLLLVHSQGCGCGCKHMRQSRDQGCAQLHGAEAVPRHRNCSGKPPRVGLHRQHGRRGLGLLVQHRAGGVLRDAVLHALRVRLDGLDDPVRRARDGTHHRLRRQDQPLRREGTLVASRIARGAHCTVPFFAVEALLLFNPHFSTCHAH